MRYLWMFLATLAALVFIAASAAMNWHFLASQGKSELEAQIFGAVSVAVDVLKAMLPFAIAAAFASGRWFRGVVVSLMLVVFVAFSLLSALGFASANRGAVMGGREASNYQLDAAQRESAAIDAKIVTIQPHRAAAVIEADSLRVRQDRRWDSSKQCSNATAAASREFCEGYFTLQRELAASVEAARLDKRRQTLKAEVRALKARGAGSDADPQAGLIARLLPVDVSTAQLGLMVFIAVMVEAGACLGLYVAAGFAADGRREATPQGRELSVEVMAPVRQPEAVTVRAAPAKRVARATNRPRGMIGSNGELLIES